MYGTEHAHVNADLSEELNEVSGSGTNAEQSKI
jgi:hypothetical protein